MTMMRRVDKGHRCPICGHDTWCLLGTSIVICMRIVSDKTKAFKGGEVGYIHDYGDKPVNRPPPHEKAPKINTIRVLNEWKRAYPKRLALLADNLGVSIKSLDDLECVTAGEWVAAWGFPMFDGYGNYIGIRVRNLAGNKWAVTGSQAGIFVPRISPEKRMFVVEGPTDTAAGLTLGYYTIGRPSCSGGVPHVMAHARRHKVSEIVIISDNDDPGIRGARDLQRYLEVASCVLVLPTKDLREFLKVGDRSAIDSMIEQLVWTQPRKAA